MNKKIVLSVTMAAMLLITGCSAKQVESDSSNETPIVIDSETIGVTEEAPAVEETHQDNIDHDFDRSLTTVFPLSEGYKWLYVGSVEYASVEVLSKIDRQHPEVTEIFIEGLIEDMSGVFMSDTSYLKQYSIFDDQIIRRFGPYESVILKSPLDKGESWENLYFDSVYGLFDARYLVREVNDRMIIIEITPASPDKDGVPSQFKLETTYEIGKGITMENRVYIYDNDGVEESFDFSYALFEENPGLEVPFVSRYFSKDPYISSVYHKGYFDYAIKEANAYQYLYQNKFRKTDQVVLEGYQNFIEGLDKEDVRSISTAENVLHIYADKMDEPKDLIGLFINHYETVLENNRYILTDWFEEGQLKEISTYNIATNDYEIGADYYAEDHDLQAKLSLMNDNGISFYFDKEQAVIKPSAEYLTNNLYYLGDIPMQAYLTLLQQAYTKAPYYRDGLSTLTLDELQTFILGFETFKANYEASYIGDASLKWGNTFLYHYLKPSSMIYRMDTLPKEVHADSLVHYKNTLQKIGDSQTASVLSAVIELIETNNKEYTTELGNFLLELGVEVPSTYLQ